MRNFDEIDCLFDNDNPGWKRRVAKMRERYGRNSPWIYVRPKPMRRRFSGTTYLSFEQTEMAMRAHYINEWLDEGETVLGRLSRGDPTEYAELQEALEPGIDDILCEFKDGTSGRIYGYKREPKQPDGGSPCT